MAELYTGYYRSPIGLMEIAGAPDGIVSARFIEGDIMGPRGGSPDVDACVDQLDGYFTGRRKDFALRLAPRGTSFQRLVWNELVTIPFGRAVTYRAIASALGRDRAVRAVGHANGRNRIGVIVPCHRVMGSDGKLRGYADGLWRKEWLLRHERALS